jgi:hypothetical protein
MYCLYLHEKTNSSCSLVTISHTFHYLQAPDDDSTTETCQSYKQDSYLFEVVVCTHCLGV